LITILFYFAVIGLYCIIINMLKERDTNLGIRFSKVVTLPEYLSAAGQKLYHGDERRKRNVIIAVKLLIGLLSIRTTIKAYRAGGIRFYSNPSLYGILIFICCIVSIACTLWTENKPGRSLPSWHKYISFAGNLGCSLNFFTMALLAISGEGLKAFIEPRWSADASVFLLCPALSLIIWLMEKNDYKLINCMLTSIPFVLMPLISKAAIYINNMTGAYGYEIENFYSTGALIVVISGAVLYTIPCYFFNKLVKNGIRSGKSLITQNILR